MEMTLFKGFFDGSYASTWHAAMVVGVLSMQKVFLILC